MKSYPLNFESFQQKIAQMLSLAKVVLVFATRFFFGLSGFPPSSKINISKFQFNREFEGHGFVSLHTTVMVLTSLNKFVYHLNFLACPPNPYKLSILGDNWGAIILPFSFSKYFNSCWRLSNVVYLSFNCLSLAENNRSLSHPLTFFATGYGQGFY